MALTQEVARRRTFGIISHPDAGKTTLTEQLLVLGGAVRQAGDVRARKTDRYAASDWLAIEQQRGISVTASAMQFDYAERTVNLLDTPGHEDFSEDTYRVLTAVDSALMVIDSVKGVESRTRQLMEVCRLRDTPILTFINKLDREGRDAFDLLQDIEDSLGIAAAPLAWPVGMGSRLQGLYLLEGPASPDGPAFLPLEGRTDGDRIPVSGPDDPVLVERIGVDRAVILSEELELLEAGAPFEYDAYRAGRQTPVLFGIALTGFGVESLLDTFVDIAPPPRPRETASERTVEPTEPHFTGLVFKVQANMDPAHRDRVAFIRVCSGAFERGMRVQHQRAGRDLRVSNPVLFQAQSRAGVETAYPGDIVGIPNHGTLRIGDTLTTGEALRFTGIPSFAPEHFRTARVENALDSKKLEKGLAHLTEEGAIQLFRPLTSNDYVLGAVGPLQFDVISARLPAEYNVEVKLSPAPYALGRWVSGPHEAVDALKRTEAHRLALDSDGDLVFLGQSDFWLEQVQRDHPKLTFSAVKQHG